MEKQKMEKSRIQWIDVAKAIAMILVVLVHSLQGNNKLQIFFCQIPLPLFAFCSGVVFSEKYTKSIMNIKMFIIKKFKILYLPFIMWNLAFLIFHNFLYRIHFISSVNGNTLLCLKDFFKQGILILTLGSGESLAGPTWYLIPLLEITITFAIIVYIANKLCRNIYVNSIYIDIITIIFVAVLMFLFANKDLPRHLSDASRLMVFYATGFYCKKYNLSNDKFKLHIEMLISCVFIAITYICSLYSSSWDGRNLLIVHISTFSGIIACISISRIVVNYAHSNVKKVFEYIGQNTMGILTLHLFAFCFVKGVYVSVYNLPNEVVGTTAAIAGGSVLWTLLYVVVGIGVPLLLYTPIKKLKNVLLLERSNTKRTI